MHLGNFLPLPLDDVAVPVVLRALLAVCPHAAVELILKDALRQRPDCFDGFDFGLDTRDLLLHVAPRRITSLKRIDLDGNVVEQKLLDEVRNALDLLDVKRKGLAHRGASTVRIELSAARVCIDDRVELTQKCAIILPLENMNRMALTPPFVQKALPRLFLESVLPWIDEILKAQDHVFDDEQAEDVLLTERCLGLNAHPCCATAGAVFGLKS